jgi:hypothetical protein
MSFYFVYLYRYLYVSINDETDDYGIALVFIHLLEMPYKPIKTNY